MDVKREVTKSASFARNGQFLSVKGHGHHNKHESGKMYAQIVGQGKAYNVAMWFA